VIRNEFRLAQSCLRFACFVLRTFAHLCSLFNKIVMTEKIKVWIAGLIAAAGIASYYGLSTQPTLARVGAMLGLLVLAVVVLWFSQSGKDFVAYAKDSVSEAKRVTWPTRKEAMQSTVAVFIFVFLMGLFLWFVDSILLWITQKLLGT
jgi:preprotein translocase subunit SecE